MLNSGIFYNPYLDDEIIDDFDPFKIHEEDNYCNILGLNMNNGKSNYKSENTNSTFEISFPSIFNKNPVEPDNCDYINYLNEYNDNCANKNLTKKKKIFEIKKVPKRGRDRKNCTKKGKHNNKCRDNACKSIINKGVSISICPFFQKVIKEFALNNNKRRFKLGPFKSNKYLEKGYNQISDFFETSIKELFCNAKTKFGSLNKRKINALLEYELNNDHIKIKKLNLLFNAPIKAFEFLILNDEKYINIEGNEFYLGDDFKTLKDYFNDGDKVFTDEEKEIYKNHIIKIMRKEVHTRNRKSKQ